VLALMLRKKKFPHAANHRLTDLKLVFKWAKKHRLMSDNPAADVDKLPVPNTGGFHPWSDLERQQYCSKHPPGTTARDCYELTWNSGQRINDVIKFGSHNLKHDADGD
jgi:integrase